nr:hypothetical protein [Tanacetum cinerariifolium]
MTTPTVTSSTDSQMHNNIMAAGSRDRPPMLTTGRYSQWRSRFLRYIDTRPNGDALKKCILSGPYKPTTVIVQAVAATDDSPAIPEHTTLRKCGKLSKGYNKGKEIAKPITHPSKTASEEDSDPKQAQRDKDMQKNLALIGKYFKKIYKPTNNNLRTSLNSRNKNVDTTPWKNVGSLVVQQSGIQCFNCKEFGHFAKECRKLKKVKDSAYPKEKMLLCKQAEQGKNDARYNVFANDLQHSKQSESISNTWLVETNDSNVIPDSPDMCDDDIENDQNDVESDDEHVALPNLFANLKHDECKTILAETSNALGESISGWDSGLVALQTKETEFEKYKAFNDRTIDYDKLERMYQLDNMSTQTRAPQSPQTVRNTNPRMSTSTGVNHTTNVSRPQHKSNQLKDKVILNNSQVKPKKTQVEVQPWIPSISNKTKSVTACKDSLNSRTSNANAILLLVKNV